MVSSSLAMAMVAQHRSLATALPSSPIKAAFRYSNRLHCAASPSSSSSSSSSSFDGTKDRLDVETIEQRDVGEMEQKKSLVKRSELIAKQVVCVADASCLGYVSQLWIDAEEWCVKALELKPSLLFGEVEGIFLSSLLKLGDIVLIEDENCLQGDLHLPSYDSLVGCNLVTERGRQLGKVRDYVFDLTQGKLSYLEFDPFGVPFLPPTMISTYRLSIDDVVVSTADSVLVKAGSESRIRRLTKGLLNLRQQAVGQGPRRRKRVKAAVAPEPRLPRTDYSYQDEKLDEILESHLRQTSEATLLRYSPLSEQIEYD